MLKTTTKKTGLFKTSVKRIINVICKRKKIHKHLRFDESHNIIIHFYINDKCNFRSTKLLRQRSTKKTNEQLMQLKHEQRYKKRRKEMYEIKPEEIKQMRDDDPIYINIYSEDE